MNNIYIQFLKSNKHLKIKLFKKQFDMSCLNCGYNCCCTCDKPRGECRLCNIQCELVGRVQAIDPDYIYPDHYVCFKCRRGWKSSDRYPHNTSCITLQELRNYPYNVRKCRCSQCGDLGQKVGKNLKIPKRKKVKDWKLLEKIVVDSYNDLEKTEEYKSELMFIDLLDKLPGFKIHNYRERWMAGRPNSNARQFAIVFGDDHSPYYYNYPKHLRDYKPFIKNINCDRRLICGDGYDKQLNKSVYRNKWDIIRFYAKTYSIISWWKKLVSIKKSINFSPEKNITKNYERCMMVLDLENEILTKQLKIRVCKFFFV